MPRLVCRDAAGEMEFCTRTFDAEELNRRPGPDGTVAHGLLRIGWACVDGRSRIEETTAEERTARWDKILAEGNQT